MNDLLELSKNEKNWCLFCEHWKDGHTDAGCDETPCQCQRFVSLQDALKNAYMEGWTRHRLYSIQCVTRDMILPEPANPYDV